MDDMEALFKLYSYPGMTDYMKGLLPYDEECEYQRAYIKWMYGFYGFGMWLAFEKQTGMLIARAGLELRVLDDGTNVVELGYAVGSPYQRQGYATEICRGILGVSKDYAPGEKVHAFILPDNKPSIAFITKKLGFKYIGDIEIEGVKYREYTENNKDI